jgi:hypothetical protein
MGYISNELLVYDPGMHYVITVTDLFIWTHKDITILSHRNRPRVVTRMLILKQKEHGI